MEQGCNDPHCRTTPVWVLVSYQFSVFHRTLEVFKERGNTDQRVDNSHDRKQASKHFFPVFFFRQLNTHAANNLTDHFFQYRATREDFNNHASSKHKSPGLLHCFHDTCMETELLHRGSVGGFTEKAKINSWTLQCLPRAVCVMHFLESKHPSCVWEWAWAGWQMMLSI